MKEFDIRWFNENIKPLLSTYSASFAEIEYGRSYSAYIKRINKTGLGNRGYVLDAGGGLGQWAMALAESNTFVDVVDVLSERLLVGDIFSKRMGITNIKFTNASIEKLPFESGVYDLVICYSVIMYTKIDISLSEFYRVLKPGGRLYVMTDLWRWPLANDSGGLLYISKVIKFFLKKIIFNNVKMYGKNKFNKNIEIAGFDIISCGQDGETTFNKECSVDGDVFFYDKKQKGKEEVWEVCAIKKPLP
jgi:ubiquinone/menaquinone biosynthesis C-methylase UbiE